MLHKNKIPHLIIEKFIDLYLKDYIHFMYIEYKLYKPNEILGITFSFKEIFIENLLLDQIFNNIKI